MEDGAAQHLRPPFMRGPATSCRFENATDSRSVSEGGFGEDCELVDAALDDHASFALLYRKHLPSIYRYLYQQVGNIHDAEDLTASTFGKALDGLQRYNRKGSFAAWLFAIARNTLRDYQRAHKSRGSHVELDQMADALIDPSLSPELQAERAEQYAALRTLVQQLPLAQQEALMLRMVGQLSTKEVAAVLGRSEGAVKLLVHRAMATLRANYLAEGEDVR